jgi:hypothetical protein
MGREEKEKMEGGRGGKGSYVGKGREGKDANFPSKNS